MLAKIVTYGDDRREAIRKMVRALQDTVIFGVTTNIPFLLDILEHQRFLDGDVSTKFIEEHMEPWLPATDRSNSTWLAMAAYEVLKDGVLQPGIGTRDGDAPNDPWQIGDQWRNVS